MNAPEGRPTVIADHNGRRVQAVPELTYRGERVEVYAAAGWAGWRHITLEGGRVLSVSLRHASLFVSGDLEQAERCLRRAVA